MRMIIDLIKAQQNEKLVSAAVFSLLTISPSFAANVVIDHYMEKTELEQSPKRVVVIGFGPLDALDNFGIDPVAVSNASHLPSYLLSTAKRITHQQAVCLSLTSKLFICKTRSDLGWPAWLREI